MTRLINPDTFRAKLDELGWTVENGFQARIYIDSIIENTPTEPQIIVFAENVDEKAVADLKAELQSVLEARPKGEWGPCYENYKNGLFYRDCSICGKATITGDWKFCPYCGAEMRSENKFQDLVVFDDQPKRQLEDPDCHNEL